jgi:hypothetical protein
VSLYRRRLAPTGSGCCSVGSRVGTRAPRRAGCSGVGPLIADDGQGRDRGRNRQTEERRQR